jgi:serine protein kinase
MWGGAQAQGPWGVLGGRAIRHSAEEEAEMSRKFLKMIQEDRELARKLSWQGTFIEYLGLLDDESHELHQVARRSARPAAARIYDMLLAAGVEELEEEGGGVRGRRRGGGARVRYKFFADEFFGIEEIEHQIVRYFHAAAKGGEEARQVLYLVGPVGAGKSSLVEALKRGVERSGPIFALDGCPMQEEPLHLIPQHLREEFSEALGIPIEGDLCPVCRWRLLHEFDKRYEEFPVTLVRISARARRGIAVVPPVDPNNQDTSVLIGSEDISKLDRYPEDDPRVLSLNGAFNRGNRGIVEFIEIFKNETEYLHAIITATQEKRIPAPGKHPMIDFDGVIVAHSNEAEWNRFKADHTNEAILDRIVRIEVPYVLRLDEEVKIYRKIIRRSQFDVHIAPHTIEIASMFAILSRLRPTAKCSLMTKLRLYNGEEVLEAGKSKQVDVEELREEFPDEGMKGISTRFIMKALDNAMTESHNNCINPLSMREALIAMVKSADLADDERARLLGYLRETLHKEYLKILEKEITKAFVHSYREQAETLFQNYIDHAEAYVNKTRVQDPETHEELEPDVSLLKSIEEQIGISGSAADGFRQDVTAYMFSLLRRGQKIDYTSYEPLREAIERKLMASVRELSRIITKARTRDKEQQEKYDTMVKELIENHGYCPHCCEVVLRYAANHLWRD